LAAYHRPTDLTEALDILASEPVRIAAGCTDLFPATQAKSLQGPILDITAIDGLRGVSSGPDGWRIGAATTWSDVIRADLPPAFDGLKLAAHEVGSVQVQNAGTLAGNLCTASPAADGAPCLLTLDARVELSSVQGTRVLPLPDFLTGARQTALRPGEMVTALLVPVSATRGYGHFLKLGARKYLIISIAMVAARLEIADRQVTGATVAVGSCSAVATRLPALEQALIGQPVDGVASVVAPDLIVPSITPINDIRADIAYRRTAAVELVRRTLGGLTRQQQDAVA
jgi:CO/xanthine dehydrogenase FAD-binding subunit